MASDVSFERRSGLRLKWVAVSAHGMPGADLGAALTLI
jgi:hypothetical protein